MTQKGSIKTIEGFFVSTIEGLQDLQEQRRKVDPNTAEKIDEYCKKLQDFADGKIRPFTFIIDDPSGNSCVENPSAPTADQYCKETKYVRTKEQYEIMGYPVDQATLMEENDRMRLKEMDLQGKKMSIKAKKSTKEEQEELINKAKSYQNKSLNEKITAGGIDFSKSLDQQDAVTDASDPTKEV